MIGGAQNLSLEKVNSDGHCIFNGIIMHEFLHALGLRDLFLKKCLVLVLFFFQMNFFFVKGLNTSKIEQTEIIMLLSTSRTYSLVKIE